MGLFKWMSSKASSQGTKLKNFTRRVTSADELEKNGEFILGMVHKLSSTPDDAVQETFENAYQRMGLTEESLATTYNSLLTRFNIFMFFSIVGVSVCVWYIMEGSWAALAAIGFILYCAAQLFVSSFRMLQIRRRELLPVSYWLAVPREWWPQQFIPQPPRRSSRKQDSRKQVNSDSSLRKNVVNLNDRRGGARKD